MPRSPRAQSAATNVASIRMTNTERGALDALARAAGLNASDFVRRLLEREREANDYVEAKPGPAAPGWFHAPMDARHVFTLHHVPGRDEPLCVRRRTLGRCDSYDVEFARGRVVNVWGEDLDDHGIAVSRGYSACHYSGEGYEPRVDGFHDLQPHIVVYRSVPTPQQRADWEVRRAREQQLLRELRTRGFFDVWRIQAPEQPGRAEVEKRRAFRRDEHPEHRGDLRVGDRLSDYTKYGLDQINLFEIAAAGRVFTTTGNYRAIGADGGIYTPTDKVLYVLREPTAEELDAEGRAPWADVVRTERAYRREREAREAQERARRQAYDDTKRAVDDILNGPPKAVRDALGVLGLTWPVAQDAVERARRTAAKTQHPDRGGDEVTMRRTNQAADVVNKYIATKGAA
jgi:hypothetical protein